MKTAKELWSYITDKQMMRDEKPFLRGYLVLSVKQCNDIRELIYGK